MGNMKQHGLLEGAEQTTFIEYGAGKGYLWCALHTLCLLHLLGLLSTLPLRLLRLLLWCTARHFVLFAAAS